MILAKNMRSIADAVKEREKLKDFKTMKKMLEKIVSIIDGEANKGLYFVNIHPLKYRDLFTEKFIDNTQNLTKTCKRISEYFHDFNVKFNCSPHENLPLDLFVENFINRSVTISESSYISIEWKDAK